MVAGWLDGYRLTAGWWDGFGSFVGGWIDGFRVAAVTDVAILGLLLLALAVIVLFTLRKEVK